MSRPRWVRASVRWLYEAAVVTYGDAVNWALRRWHTRDNKAYRDLGYAPFVGQVWVGAVSGRAFRIDAVDEVYLGGPTIEIAFFELVPVVAAPGCKERRVLNLEALWEHYTPSGPSR